MKSAQTTFTSQFLLQLLISNVSAAEAQYGCATGIESCVATGLISDLQTHLIADGYSIREPTRILNQYSPPGSTTFDIDVILALLLLVCSALAAGLTQGMVSIEPLEMAIKLRSGTEEEKRYAQNVLPLISKHHLLIVTLMLFNATANEALPIVLDALMPAWLSVVLSVTLVLLMGEIIPSAVLTGPDGLRIASFLSPLVWVLIAVLFPIAYPISLALDYVLGADEGMTMYNRREIAAMMRIQHEEQAKRGTDIEAGVHG